MAVVDPVLFFFIEIPLYEVLLQGVECCCRSSEEGQGAVWHGGMWALLLRLWWLLVVASAPSVGGGFEGLRGRGGEERRGEEEG